MKDHSVALCGVHSVDCANCQHCRAQHGKMKGYLTMHVNQVNSDKRLGI